MYHDGIAVPGQRAVGPSRSAATASAGWRLRSRRWATALWREPLTHFLVFGILIFLVAHALEARSQRYVITVRPADITRIFNSYEQQYGTEPDRGQVQTMIDHYIREEIYLREGLALGLDKDDEIVRRRIAQKFDFLQQDNAAPREPSEAQLSAWFAQHRGDFALPPRRSFDQLYYAIDQRGDAAAKTLAETAAKRLAAGLSPPPADEFPGPKAIVNLGADDVQRVFGGSDFVEHVFTAPTGRWFGPLRSGFGWHVLRITAVAPGQQRSLAQAHDEVRRAWIEADRQVRNAASYRKLLARYTIRRAD